MELGVKGAPSGERGTLMFGQPRQSERSAYKTLAVDRRCGPPVSRYLQGEKPLLDTFWLPAFPELVDLVPLVDDHDAFCSVRIKAHGSQPSNRGVRVRVPY